MTLLEVTNLHRSFGSLQAVDGASFEVESGELIGIIGPNGAGKTTLFNCISGILDTDSGKIIFDEKEVTNLAPHTLARRGLARTFQKTREIVTMTTKENVLLSTPNHPGERATHAIARTKKGREREEEAEQRALELLKTFDLEAMTEEYASSLSGGQRKLLELAKILMLDPKLLMLDEPFAGVNPTLTGDIVSHIKDLNDAGLTLLIIEHELETLTDLVDRLIVLTDGDILATGPPDEIMEDQRVIDAYLGE